MWIFRLVGGWTNPFAKYDPKWVHLPQCSWWKFIYIYIFGNHHLVIINQYKNPYYQTSISWKVRDPGFFFSPTKPPSPSHSRALPPFSPWFAGPAALWRNWLNHRENSGTLGMVPWLFNTPRSPLEGGMPNKYPLYKVYMGLIIKGTIPRVPAFFLWLKLEIRYNICVHIYIYIYIQKHVHIMNMNQCYVA